MLTYLFLAYEGNYVGRSLNSTWEMFTYKGELYYVNPNTDEVIPQG
jgi:hypothetical protein